MWDLYSKVPSSLLPLFSLDLFFSVRTCGSDVLCMHPALARRRLAAPWVWGQCGLHSVARQPEPHSETLSKNTPPHTHTQSMHMPKQKTKSKQQDVNMLGRAGHVTANCPVITKVSLKCSQPSETLNRAAKYHKWGWIFQTVDPSIRLAHEVIIFTLSDGKSTQDQLQKDFFLAHVHSALFDNASAY